MTYQILLSRQAKRALTNHLPDLVAADCVEFMHGMLADNPHRVGRKADWCGH